MSSYKAIENTKIYNNSYKKWIKVMFQKNNLPLYFIHIPKAAGTYARVICDQLNINHQKAYTHKKASKLINDRHIVFAILREPVSRYESMLNYRLFKIKDTSRKPNGNIDDYNDINDFIANQTDDFLLNVGSSFQTLLKYSKFVDIFITIDEFEDFLNFFGHHIPENLKKRKNQSERPKGKFNNITINRIKKLYAKDIEFYNRHV
jgi:hypothetical protein